MSVLPSVALIVVLGVKSRSALVPDFYKHSSLEQMQSHGQGHFPVPINMCHSPSKHITSSPRVLIQEGCFTGHFEREAKHSVFAGHFLRETSRRSLGGSGSETAVLRALRVH